MASQSVGNELSPFMLEVPGLEEAAEREEKEALRGSYGFVFEVTVEGVECIAKKLHSAFTGRSRVSARERESITARFRNECIILSKLRHPNIVQFVGVHFGPKGLTLIMESLRSDLDDFLSDNPQVPLSLKLSMLRDVSYGLVYLHDERTPAIIHRDLTARNILINDNCQAKIADLGMAKIVTLQEQLAQSHTQAPGQAFYMPPEALTEKAECTPKLDIFSFGHLALYTIIQDYPKVYEVPMTMDAQKNGTFQRLKRQRSLDLVGGDHCLYSIITECLYDRPEQRPTTRDLNSQLIQLSTQHPVSMVEEMERMSEELEDLQKSLEAKTAEVVGLKEENEKMVQEIKELQSKASNFEANQVNKMTNKLAEMQLCHIEIDQLREERDTFHMEMNRIGDMYEEQKRSHKREKEDLALQVQVAEVEKQSMQARIAQLEGVSQKNEKLHELTAAMNRDLDAKLCDASHALEQMKQKLYTAEQQREHYFSQWKQEKRKLEEQLAVIARATDELSVVSQERSHHKAQADSFRVKFQDEKKRIRYIEQEMQKMEEGYREEIDYIKAQYDEKLLEQGRLMVLLQRELEQLKANAYGEGKFAEPFTRMEEKEELKSEIEILEVKNHAYLDDLTIAKDLLIKHHIPFPTKTLDSQGTTESAKTIYEVQRTSRGQEHHESRGTRGGVTYDPHQQRQPQLQQGHSHQGDMYRHPNYQQPQIPTSASSHDPSARVQGERDIQGQLGYQPNPPTPPPNSSGPKENNLICPMCKKQFRIGQIQYYKQHVDKCKG